MPSREEICEEIDRVEETDSIGRALRSTEEKSYVVLKLILVQMTDILEFLKEGQRDAHWRSDR